MVLLFSKSASRLGALLIRFVPCESTGGTTTEIKKAVKTITDTKMIATAFARERPRL